MGIFFHSNVMMLFAWKAALGDADQDQVLCKHLGRASPGCQLKSLSLQGIFPGQIWLLGQIFGSTKLLLRPHEIEPWAEQGKKNPNPNIHYLYKIKTWLKGAALLAMPFVMLPQMGSQTKILLFWCTKQFQYPLFHWVMEIQIRPWMKSTSFISYTLNPLGRLLAACLKNA